MRCAGFLLLPLLAASCSSSQSAASPSACQSPSAALLARITELAPAGSGFTVRASAGQKAATHANAYWVGVSFGVARSATALTGIWAVGGGLDGKGTILAVDPVAKQWSRAFDAARSASKIADTEGQEVLRCL